MFLFVASFDACCASLHVNFPFGTFSAAGRLSVSCKYAFFRSCRVPLGAESQAGFCASRRRRFCAAIPRVVVTLFFSEVGHLLPDAPTEYTVTMRIQQNRWFLSYTIVNEQPRGHCQRRQEHEHRGFQGTLFFHNPGLKQPFHCLTP